MRPHPAFRAALAAHAREGGLGVGVRAGRRAPLPNHGARRREGSLLRPQAPYAQTRRSCSRRTRNFASRARAQAAIAAGLVSADGEPVRKASDALVSDAQIEASEPHPWASRGGIKLAAALDAFGLDPHGLACLDVGASTGGFTDVLLARGARSVVAIDVGRGQLDPRLAADPRVSAHEGLDARRLTAEIAGAPEAIVIDVSFISQTLTLPVVLSLASRRPGSSAWSSRSSRSAATSWSKGR